VSKPASSADASSQRCGRQETSGRSAAFERELLGSQAGNTLKTHAVDTSVGAAKGHERKGREGVPTARRRRTWRRRSPGGERATTLGNTGVGATDSATEQSPEGGIVVVGAAGNRRRLRLSTDARARADDESAQAVVEEQTPVGRTLDVAAG
jgi:hypothetical protein